MSGVQDGGVISCREIKPYGRPARLAFFYVLLTVTHVCVAILTCRRYASPLWSHVVCCCKTGKETESK